MASSMALVAGAKLLEKVLSDIYESAKGETKAKLRRWNTTRKSKSLYSKISTVRNVKTIWQVDKEVDLMQFYYPSRIAYDGKAVIVNDLKDIPYRGNIVIQGTAGQGKSIFLRYLCARQLQSGGVIPLFIELRRLEQGLSLRSLIIKSLNVLGLPSDDVLDHLLATGSVTLFLDAFDEIDETLRAGTIAELEDIARTNEMLRILITSRPDSGIQLSACFRVLQLSPLGKQDTSAVIHKLAPTGTLANELINALKRDLAGISELLTTPLMVTLLVITYKAEQRLPEQLFEFYEGLFGLLLSRHDQSKPGFIRKRKCTLNDRSMRQTFDALCFLFRKLGKAPPSTSQTCDLIQQALSVHGLQADPESVLFDLRKITCLLIEDGGRVFFIHKSVAEYHSACFITNRPREIGKKFYEHLLKSSDWGYWRQELEFLAQIDKYRYSRYFLPVEVSRLLGDGEGNVGDDWRMIGRDRGLSLVGDIAIAAFISDATELSDWWSAGYKGEAANWAATEFCNRVMYPLVRAPFFMRMAKSLRSHLPSAAEVIDSPERQEGRMVKLFVRDLLPALDNEDRRLIDSVLDDVIEWLHERYAEARDYVLKCDQSSAMFDDLGPLAEGGKPN